MALSRWFKRNGLRRTSAVDEIVVLLLLLLSLPQTLFFCFKSFVIALHYSKFDQLVTRLPKRRTTLMAFVRDGHKPRWAPASWSLSGSSHSVKNHGCWCEFTVEGVELVSKGIIVAEQILLRKLRLQTRCGFRKWMRRRSLLDLVFLIWMWCAYQRDLFKRNLLSSRISMNNVNHRRYKLWFLKRIISITLELIDTSVCINPNVHKM